jgi:hypothetical protein
MIHVIPRDDWREHTMSKECWCKPTPEADMPDVIGHHAADNREATETHENPEGGWMVIDDGEQPDYSQN